MYENYGRKCKEIMVEGIANQLKDSPDLFVAKFSSVPANEMDQLRKDLRKAQARCLVIKNSIAKVAFDKADLSTLSKLIEGSCFLTISGSDVALASKTLIDFSKTHPGLAVEGGIISGKLADAGMVKELASLPPKEVLLALVVGGIKSPITAFVGVLTAATRSLLYALKGVIDKKEKKQQGRN